MFAIESILVRTAAAELATVKRTSANGAQSDWVAVCGKSLSVWASARVKSTAGSCVRVAPKAANSHLKVPEVSCGLSFGANCVAIVLDLLLAVGVEGLGISAARSDSHSWAVQVLVVIFGAIFGLARAIAAVAGRWLGAGGSLGAVEWIRRWTDSVLNSGKQGIFILDFLQWTSALGC